MHTIQRQWYGCQNVWCSIIYIVLYFTVFLRLTKKMSAQCWIFCSVCGRLQISMCNLIGLSTRNPIFWLFDLKMAQRWPAWISLGNVHTNFGFSIHTHLQRLHLISASQLYGTDKRVGLCKTHIVRPIRTTVYNNLYQLQERLVSCNCIRRDLLVVVTTKPSTLAICVYTKCHTAARCPHVVCIYKQYVMPLRQQADGYTRYCVT